VKRVSLQLTVSALHGDCVADSVERYFQMKFHRLDGIRVSRMEFDGEHGVSVRWRPQLDRKPDLPALDRTCRRLLECETWTETKATISRNSSLLLGDHAQLYLRSLREQMIKHNDLSAVPILDEHRHILVKCRMAASFDIIRDDGAATRLSVLRSLCRPPVEADIDKLSAILTSPETREMILTMICCKGSDAPQWDKLFAGLFDCPGGGINSTSSEVPASRRMRLAELYFDRGDMTLREFKNGSAAREMLKGAVDIFQALGFSKRGCSSNYWYAVANLAVNDEGSALDALRQSIKLAEESNDIEQIIQSKRLFGKRLLVGGQTEEAGQYLTRSMDTALFSCEFEQAQLSTIQVAAYARAVRSNELTELAFSVLKELVNRGVKD
jgi:hypothetical protein